MAGTFAEIICVLIVIWWVNCSKLLDGCGNEPGNEHYGLVKQSLE
jgi:hypothetical protein